MSLKSLIRLVRPQEPAGLADKTMPAHLIDSTFRAARCRFELACVCGAAFDTPYIDAALEWHELHMELAPLADELSA